MAASGNLTEKVFAEWFGPLLQYAIDQLVCVCAGQNGRLMLFTVRGKSRMERMLPGTVRIGPIIHWAWFDAGDLALAVARFVRANTGFVTVSLSQGDLQFTGRRHDGGELKVTVSTADHTGVREAAAVRLQEVTAKLVQVVPAVAPQEAKRREQWQKNKEKRHERERVVRQAMVEVQQEKPKLTQRQMTLLQRLGPRPTKESIRIPTTLKPRKTKSGRNRAKEYYRKRVIRLWETQVQRVMELTSAPVAAATPVAPVKKKWPKKSKDRIKKDTANRRRKREEARRQMELSLKAGQSAS